LLSHRVNDKRGECYSARYVRSFSRLRPCDRAAPSQLTGDTDEFAARTSILENEFRNSSECFPSSLLNACSACRNCFHGRILLGVETQSWGNSMNARLLLSAKIASLILLASLLLGSSLVHSEELSDEDLHKEYQRRFQE